MPHLDSLVLTQHSAKAMRVRGITTIRQKLVDRISDQIALAKAHEAGEAYQRVKFRRVKNLESDEVADVPVKIRVRPWWIEDKDGSILLWIKYGNQTLELAKGKPSIRIKTRAELVSTLETVRTAVRAGELDQLIQTAAGSFKTRFGK